MAIDTHDEPVQPLGWIRRWGPRGFWALADQGLVSVSNLALNVILARWLAPDEYGAFTVGFSVLLVVASLHAALLTDPMLVFATGRFARRPDAYLRVLILGHWILTGPLALAALAAGLVAQILWTDFVSPVLAGLAVATPFYLLLTLLRRAFYARLQPKDSAVGSGLYLAFSLLGVVALERVVELSPASGFVALALGSLVADGWLLLRLRAKWSVPTRAELAEVLSAHWGFGRWGLGANLAQWISSNLYYLVLPIWAGLEASAGFRAMTNLVIPLTQALTAIGPLLLAAFTRARERADFSAGVWRITLSLAAGAVVYWLLLSWLAEPVLHWLYSGKYLEHAHLAWVIGLIPVCHAIGMGAGAALRAMERPDRDFPANVASAAIPLTLGVLFVWLLGVTGAVIGWALTSAVATLLTGLTFVFLQTSQRRSASLGE